MRKSNSKPAIWAVIALCALVVAFAAIYGALRPHPTAGGKTIEVEIVQLNGESKTLEIKTDAEYLRQALEEQNLIQGDESQFGLFVKTVDGISADDGKQEWWCFTKGGEQLMTGVDETPVSDGEHYEITLNAGY